MDMGQLKAVTVWIIVTQTRPPIIDALRLVRLIFCLLFGTKSSVSFLLRFTTRAKGMKDTWPRKTCTCSSGTNISSQQDWHIGVRLRCNSGSWVQIPCNLQQVAVTT
jgi:hypothetical protein